MRLLTALVREPRWMLRFGAAPVFALLTIAMTWPQVAGLATHGVDHQDVYFNLWRLRWVAHALIASPTKLFDGNIFHPASHSLAFSDAMLVEGIIAAPLLWARVPPMLVHNLLLLGAFIGSAAGMFVLARHLTGSAAGGIIAGIIFAFAPYRFEHYMHMELQWAVWMPWAFWALQRTVETHKLRFGVITGIFAALQMLSSVYYGMFLALMLAVVSLLQIAAMRGRELLVTVRALMVTAGIIVTVAGLYSIPYRAASSQVGLRGREEVIRFSGKPRNYLVATPTNLLYGSRLGRPERRLSPGILAPVLALVGLLLVVPSKTAVIYVVGLVGAFELSLGMYGQVYPLLYEWVPGFQGLRAPARASILVLLFLGVLAAFGCAAVQNSVASARRALVAIPCIAILLLEYWVAPLAFVPYDNRPPPLYAYLARLPHGVVAEFPMPTVGMLPYHEPRYSYMSTFHWMPLINGYSGYYPPTYLHRLDPLRRFPDESAIAHLRDDGVRYIVVHSSGYMRAEFKEILWSLGLRLGLPQLGQYEDGWGYGVVFEIR